MRTGSWSVVPGFLFLLSCSTPGIPRDAWSFEGRSYAWIPAEGRTWEQAGAHARSLGGELAMLQTDAEFRHVVERLRDLGPGGCAWLGALIPGGAGQAGHHPSWLDGTSIFPYTHEHWIRNGLGNREPHPLFLEARGKLCANPEFLGGRTPGHFLVEWPGRP